MKSLFRLSCFFLCFAIQPLSAQKPSLGIEIKIWPDGAPGSNSKNWPWENYREKWTHDTTRNEDLVIWVTEPSIRVFLPDESKNTGAAVIVCPGGGYNIIEIDKEGFKVARRLQELGIAAIVLKYRHYSRFAALDDAHRAIRYVRNRAEEWKINPKSIGIGGFSAGGNLALHAAANLHPKTDWIPDSIDLLNNRPDFLMLIYPATDLPKEANIDKSLPPSFLTVAADDNLMKQSLNLFTSLQQLGVPSELHVYEKGGHGFGTGNDKCMCREWIGIFRNWLSGNNFLRKPL